MKKASFVVFPAMLVATSIAPSPASAQSQWWNPSDRATLSELSYSHGLPPPGFLDDHKRASLSLLTSSQAVKEAIKAGNFASFVKPTSQQLQAALGILDRALKAGEQDLPLSLMRVQVLAVMNREPYSEARLALARYKMEPSPYLAYEAALCEWWGMYRSKDRTVKHLTLDLLKKWKTWSPATEREESVHSLVSCATGVQVGRVQIAPINAAEHLGRPELLEWMGFHFSEGQVDMKTGRIVRTGGQLPDGFKNPPIATMQRLLSRCSDQHPKRYLAALHAFRFSREIGLTKEAIVYAKRYLAHAPDHSASKQEAKNFIAKHE